MKLGNWFAACWLGASALAVSACTLTVDLDALENGECPSGQKFCGGRCVEISAAAYGCTRTGCAPCNLTGANMGCRDNTCVVTSCRPPNQNCDNMDSTGCEVNINTDPRHCGRCGNVCQPMNAEADCALNSTGVAACDYRRCNTGYNDCNGNRTDGCETLGACPASQ